MTYTVKRIGIKSAAKVALVCLIILTIPMIPAFLTISTMSTAVFGEATPSANIASLASGLAIPLLYGVFAALGAAILALVYNLSVRIHGGIKLDIELGESSEFAEKKKN